MGFYDELPSPPKGLEYEYVNDEPLMCENCMGYVETPNVLLRKNSQRRNITFEKHFPEGEGICLDCAKEKFGDILNNHYASVNRNLEQEEEVVDKEKQALLSVIIDAETAFIETIGEFLNKIDHIDINYVNNCRLLKDIVNEEEKENDETE